jgi:hypothetical protein
VVAGGGGGFTTTTPFAIYTRSVLGLCDFLAIQVHNRVCILLPETSAVQLASRWTADAVIVWSGGLLGGGVPVSLPVSLCHVWHL